MFEKSSRREFLRTAAGGIAASWGGVRIFAEPDAFDRYEKSERPKIAQKFFVYGSTFYRPPNPPASERRTMLQAIAEKYKFNTIRIYSAWAYNNPERDHFEFSELEEVLRYCDEFGLKVLQGVVIEDAPYWLEAAHPETRYVNANDHAQRLEGSGNNVSGGWPGLCLDWQPVRDAAAEFIREMVKVVSTHSSIYAYDCWNEPHIEPAGGHYFPETAVNIEGRVYCYCSRTIAEFQGWLQKRYGTLEQLNEAWVRRYPSWTTIDPPREQGTYLDWVDWRRFMIERSTVEMRFRVENVRAVDSHSLIESHAGMQVTVEGSSAIVGINPWRLAEVVETWGLSNFPRWQMMPIYLGAARLELTRCQAGNKPFWMTELQGGHGSSGLARSRRMRPRDIRLWNWMGVATGAKGLLYWAYDTEATGTESSGFGLVARDGSPTERVLEAADDNRLIQTHWDIIENYKPRPEVAILVDQDSALLTFAMSGNEDASADSFRGYYKALWNCDAWVDYIEPQSLPGNNYKVIIVPWHLMGKRETCEHLRKFVEAGGTLVLETGFGMYDERTFYNPVIPPYGLAEAFGYREGESFYIQGGGESANPDAIFGNKTSKAPKIPASERVYIDGHLDFTDPIAVTVRAHTFLTPLIVGTATVIAKYESTPVATRKKVERGQVYYIGTNLGASIEAGDQGGIDLMRAILAGVVQPTVTADKVRPRLVEGAADSLLMVFNEGAEDQLSEIKVPSRYHRATDLYSNKKQTIQGNSIRVAVPFEGVSVLRLE
jgi:beta-galactosidase GanA